MNIPSYPFAFIVFKDDGLSDSKAIAGAKHKMNLVLCSIPITINENVLPEVLNFFFFLPD